MSYFLSSCIFILIFNKFEFVKVIKFGNNWLGDAKIDEECQEKDFYKVRIQINKSIIFNLLFKCLYFLRTMFTWLNESQLKMSRLVSCGPEERESLNLGFGRLKFILILVFYSIINDSMGVPG